MTLRKFTCLVAIAALALLALPTAAEAAAAFTVKTVPWVASNSLIPHDTYAGKAIHVKGACEDCTASGHNYHWIWSFGDAGTPVSGDFAGGSEARWAIGAAHTYSGAVTQLWTATLTIQDTSVADQTASANYYVQMRATSLAVQANVAIDEGLWYLHSNLSRRYSTDDDGYWAWSGYYGVQPANLNAFEANGHLEGGPTSDPYTETARRSIRYVLKQLTTGPVSSQTNPHGTFTADGNSNGRYMVINQSQPNYQTGMFMDALVASGTPTKAAPAYGDVARTYKDVVQDMADWYSICQQDSGAGGAWGYNCNESDDNSVSQWAAIGMIPAERNWGVVIPNVVKTWNAVWLTNDQDASGAFGYNGAGSFPWGPYAVTPSGLVQAVLDGIGQGDPRWDNAERFLCDNFANTGGITVAIRSYYYGLFSFVKSMRLAVNNTTKVPEPVTNLRCTGGSTIDWYLNPTIGVVATLTGAQSADGSWSGHYNDGNQNPFETAWAVLMLGTTIFESGGPVAVAKATPNPSMAGQTITVSGADSYHQDAGKSIVKWEWDLDYNGTYEFTGVSTTISYPTTGLYHVNLRVTDNNVPVKTNVTTLDLNVNTPPIAPTANAGGPYNFCPGPKWFLDGTGSINPDEGQYLAGYGPPGDTIHWRTDATHAGFMWDTDGNGAYDNGTVAGTDETLDVTARWGVGNYIVGLKVTDQSDSKFPPNAALSSTSTAQVHVYASGAAECACVTNLVARGSISMVGLTWTARVVKPAGYNIYRSTTNGGPYTQIGTASATATAYTDKTAVSGTYYYIVREKAANGYETCQSTQASGIAIKAK